MENPTLPTNWLAALSNARSASQWVTLAQKLEDSISDFRKILSLATKTTSDFRNPGRKRARQGRIAAICTFTAPVAARFSGIRRLSCRII